MKFFQTRIRFLDCLCLLVLTLFVFLTSKAVFHPGFFRTIDDITPVRVVYMEKELLRDNWLNNFPVRMSGELSNNYGYPLYLYYAPLTYYAGAFFMIFLKVSNIVASKYLYVFPLLIGPYLFYFAARQKLSPFPAFLGSLLFTFFPYRGYDTYIRGAVAEAWGVALIPLAMSGIFLIQNKKRFGGTVFSLGLFLILISHNLVGLMFLALALLFGTIYLLKSKEFWKSLLLGLGMSSFYLIPVVYYLKQVGVTMEQMNTTNVVFTLINIRNFFLPNFYTPLVPELFPGITGVPGISGIFLLLLIFGVTYLFYLKKNGRKNTFDNLFWGITGLIIYALLFQPLGFVWNLTWPLTGILQFAWRVLTLLSFIIPLFVGYIIYSFNNAYLKIAAVIVVFGLALGFFPAFKPESYSFFYEYKAEGECATTSWQNEYLPIWVKKCPLPQVPLQILPEGNVSLLTDKSLDIKANVVATQPAMLIVNKYYFPGWHVLIDKKEAVLEYKSSIYGTISTPISQGSHFVEIVYEKTPLMWLADIISVSSLLIFGISFASLLRRHKVK